MAEKLITRIRMPDGRVIERVSKAVIDKALRAAGKKSAALRKTPKSPAPYTGDREP